jgi:hypothetical protein
MLSADKECLLSYMWYIRPLYLMTSPNQENPLPYRTFIEIADHMLEFATLKFIDCSKSTNILLIFTKKIIDKKTHGIILFNFRAGCTRQYQTRYNKNALGLASTRPNMSGLGVVLDPIVTGLLYCFFYLKRYLFKFLRIFASIKRNLLKVLVTSHIGLPNTKYKLSTILARENRRDYYDKLINHYKISRFYRRNFSVGVRHIFHR